MKATRANVTDVASAVYTPASTNVTRPRAVIVKNAGASAVFLGGADVASTTGYQVDANEVLSYDTVSVEPLYAVCAAAGTATLHILRYGDT